MFGEPAYTYAGGGDDYDTPRTYEERVGRYRIVRRTNYDPSTEFGAQARAEMSINGIDPDDCWSLIWSFDDEDAANEQLAEEQQFWKEPRYTTKLVDNGEATVITRPIY